MGFLIANTVGYKEPLKLERLEIFWTFECLYCLILVQSVQVAQVCMSIEHREEQMKVINSIKPNCSTYICFINQ